MISRGMLEAGCFADESNDRMPGFALLPQDHPLGSCNGANDRPHAVGEPAPLRSQVDRIGFNPVEALLDRRGNPRERRVQAVESACRDRVEFQLAHRSAGSALTFHTQFGVGPGMSDLGLEGAVGEVPSFEFSNHDSRFEDESAVRFFVHQVSAIGSAETGSASGIRFHDLVAHITKPTLIPAIGQVGEPTSHRTLANILPTDSRRQTLADAARGL